MRLEPRTDPLQPLFPYSIEQITVGGARKRTDAENGLVPGTKIVAGSLVLMEDIRKATGISRATLRTYTLDGTLRKSTETREIKGKAAALFFADDIPGIMYRYDPLLTDHTPDTASTSGDAHGGKLNSRQISDTFAIPLGRIDYMVKSGMLKPGESVRQSGRRGYLIRVWSRDEVAEAHAKWLALHPNEVDYSQMEDHFTRTAPQQTPLVTRTAPEAPQEVKVPQDAVYVAEEAKNGLVGFYLLMELETGAFRTSALNRGARNGEVYVLRYTTRARLAVFDANLTPSCPESLVPIARTMIAQQRRDNEAITLAASRAC